ncbi:hypothetical protein Syun_031433 [Stephania yunnanensis]|uniref:Uncharacterized protein n=1 Tax=Stephania yunnanensis TaxID=152371 RepID=A0AAP0DY87_9MAGN
MSGEVEEDLRQHQRSRFAEPAARGGELSNRVEDACTKSETKCSATCKDEGSVGGPGRANDEWRATKQWTNASWRADDVQMQE